ncbi:Putative sialic acid transporter [Planctomycetes bacterium Pan216]|uniref:Sialic acid transporter n=1 Tax=Kolteria novifilia TaxID=2527975 RepID=A0A518BBE3_9BACT|nr:Putative sialic acid transporter [Planctomycetes bacterium Pan216]
MNSTSEKTERWYHGVTRYQWLVLAIASAGWVFDVYEGQVFNITRTQMLSDILGGEGGDVKRYGDFFLAIFLLGGTVGGLAAGSLADRFGRRPIMVVTILMYSLFSGLTFFATELWQVAALRFLVALGVGGEWAVAASLVAEVFPVRARAHASGIFQASSVLGTWFAALAGIAVGAQWRYAYLIGIIPALLVLWIRSSVREPESWQATKSEAESSEGGRQLGSFRELLLTPQWGSRALLGMALAAIGLGTFWSVTVAGQDLARELLLREGTSPDIASRNAKFAFGIVQTAGGGLGLLAFGPLCARFGRRFSFVAMQLLAFLIVPVTCYLPGSFPQLLVILPVFGFFTLGIHSGYAIYFPELFPTHLRATGTSFCFNGGRVLAVPVLLFSGWLKSQQGVDLRLAITALGSLFLVGVVLMFFLPETKGKELPR